MIIIIFSAIILVILFFFIFKKRRVQTPQQVVQTPQQVLSTQGSTIVNEPIPQAEPAPKYNYDMLIAEYNSAINNVEYDKILDNKNLPNITIPADVDLGDIYANILRYKPKIHELPKFYNSDLSQYGADIGYNAYIIHTIKKNPFLTINIDITVINVAHLDNDTIHMLQKANITTRLPKANPINSINYTYLKISRQGIFISIISNIIQTSPTIIKRLISKSKIADENIEICNEILPEILKKNDK